MKASFGLGALLVAAMAGFVLSFAARSQEYKTESASPPSAIEVPMPAPQDPRSTAEATELSEPEHGIPQPMPQAEPANGEQGTNSTLISSAPISQSSSESDMAATPMPGPNTKGLTKKRAAPLPQVVRGGPTRPLKPHRPSGSMYSAYNRGL